MATRHEIKACVFDRFSVAFTRLPQAAAAATADEYARVLARYDAQTLTRAVDQLIETHGYRSWPSVAACRTACEHAAASAASSAPSRATPIPPVDAVMTSALGHGALAQGWGASLKDFVCRTGRAPDDSEAVALRHAAVTARSAANTIGDLRDQRLRRWLGRLRRQIHARETALARRYGAAAPHRARLG